MKGSPPIAPCFLLNSCFVPIHFCSMHSKLFNLCLPWFDSGVEAWASGRMDDFGKLITASGRSSIDNYECGTNHIIISPLLQSRWWWLLSYAHMIFLFRTFLMNPIPIIRFRFQRLGSMSDHFYVYNVPISLFRGFVCWLYYGRRPKEWVANLL